MDPHYERAVAVILEAVPDATAIYLFGSRARDEAGAGSDVDLAVLRARTLPPVARWQLQERLASVLHADVDLVDLAAASTVMRVQVLDGSRLLFERDATSRALFEARALASYARLNEERRGILDDVRAAGRVHG